jgi:hypothetical protein
MSIFATVLPNAQELGSISPMETETETVTIIDRVIAAFVREAQGDMSDKELARLSGVARTKLGEMKSLKKPFRTLHVAKLIQALGMSPRAAFTAMARLTQEVEQPQAEEASVRISGRGKRPDAYVPPDVAEAMKQVPDRRKQRKKKAKGPLLDRTPRIDPTHR